MTQEESTKVQTAAEERMEQKLLEDKQYEKAEEFAKMTVWSTYQPIVNGVAAGAFYRKSA